MLYLTTCHSETDYFCLRPFNIPLTIAAAKGFGILRLDL